MSSLSYRGSMRPVSTVVGSRDITDAITAENMKREICLWFEDKLDLRMYLRDKKNEERIRLDKFVRINSKLLRCSYQIPADDIYLFLKRLRALLIPGLKIEARKKHDRGSCDDKEEEHLKVLFNWTTCSDFTTQSLPQAPTALWLDLECMPCKRGERLTTKKHLRSKDVIKTVVTQVLSYMGGEDTVASGKCDYLYVTRGRTCGMHLFFPQVTVNSEEELQDVWSLINNGFKETGQNDAFVDTGCSAIPLPLARKHNGLTRVLIQKIDTEIRIRSYELREPGVKDLARVTNFYNFFVDALQKRPSSPCSSITTNHSADNIGGEKSQSCLSVSTDTRLHHSERTTHHVSSLDDCKEDYTNVANVKEENILHDVGPTSDSIEISHNMDVQEFIVDDDNVSNLSTQSVKRMVQSDIRTVCANLKPRKRTYDELSDVGCTLSERSMKLHKGDGNVYDGFGVSSERDQRSPLSSRLSSAESFARMGFVPTEATVAQNDAEYDVQSTDEGSWFEQRDTEQQSRIHQLDSTNNKTTIPSRGTSTCQSAPERVSQSNVSPRDTVPIDARLPVLYLKSNGGETSSRTVENPTHAKEQFRSNMTLRLSNREHRMHETDIQHIVSAYNSEVDFYTDMINSSTPLTCNEFKGLRIRSGCSLNENREDCPKAMFPEFVPLVLWSEDFVKEAEWLSIVTRYFDEYVNDSTFLYIMLHVLENDENVDKSLDSVGKRLICESVKKCLMRFETDTHEGKLPKLPKHPYDDKCTVVFGLVAVCSLAFKVVTPIFTDFGKVCRLLLSDNFQTLDSLNTSTMSTAAACGGPPFYEDIFFDDSASQVNYEPGSPCGVKEDDGEKGPSNHLGNGGEKLTANMGNDHSVLASILRYLYPALGEQTLWCLSFYYHHVHADALTRIMDEVVHGGLMITAVLQAYLENCNGDAPVDWRSVCHRVYKLSSELVEKNQSRDGQLMPPPKRGVKRKQAKCREGDGSSPKLFDREGKRLDYEKGDDSEKRSKKKRLNLLIFEAVLSLFVGRYLRPVLFDETSVVYTESGYDQNKNQYSSYFSQDSDIRKTATDTFSRKTLRYSMPHGDLLMYNTDVMSTVHRRSSCTNNLVLNIFENMYGGCMSYLTRRFHNHLKLYNRFNGDAYRLVVECRHAMHELIKSVDVSYVNLILRQPVVPPLLESDISVRNMFMSEEELSQGAFVCLNSMDYVRSVNMFTKHSRYSQHNCQMVESFLDCVIVDHEPGSRGIDEDARANFRTVYLFYLLYIFEVLYKIRHAYNRDRTFNVSIERLSWDMDVRVLLKIFFGLREFSMPRGLSPEALQQLDMTLYEEQQSASYFEEDLNAEGENRTAASRCINTRPVVSTVLPDKVSRMVELFGKKGLTVMKSYGRPCESGVGITVGDEGQSGESNAPPNTASLSGGITFAHTTMCNDSNDNSRCGSDTEFVTESTSCEELDRGFLDMTHAQLENELYSRDKWYENCRVRMKAVRTKNNDGVRETDRMTGQVGDLEMCMDRSSMDTFLRTQLRVNIDNDRLNNIERSVRQKQDFAFCTYMPLRTKMMALVLATHSIKRLTSDVATDFVRKEYFLEQSGVVKFTKANRKRTQVGEETTVASYEEADGDYRPDHKWTYTWSKLLGKRRQLLTYCRTLAATHFPESYFAGLQPENTYNALYKYMLTKSKYTTLQATKNQPWAKDVCTALNYLLVMNGYDPELVDLCLRLFLGFEWPGQWAKRIFVWKSNSNAGKSFLFEHVLRKAFDQSTCINDPKCGKENAPEKSEYYKNFVLMINEFTTAHAAELKRLCSTSSYKFRMNFGNQMIQAFMVGKMVFNCNTLPMTTDHATIQRVALVPLTFWFQKRQSVVDSMLNWTRGHSVTNEYEKKFKRNVSHMLSGKEQNFFMENRNTKNEDGLFTSPQETFGEHTNSHAKASMFLVQNKTSQVYMLSDPPVGQIVSGIVFITKYFCRFRYFNTIKEPVDYSTLPRVCTAATQEWQRLSQPYFDWKDKYRVQQDYSVVTRWTEIFNSLKEFAKNHKNVSVFDLQQFFEWDFAEYKIPYYNLKSDGYNVRLDRFQD